MQRGARTVTLAAAAAFSLALARPVVAEPSPPAGIEGEVFTGPPVIPKGRTYSERIADQLTLLGDSIDSHVGALSLDTIKFKVDGRHRKAHVRLAGESRYLSLTIQSDVHFRQGAARVDASIDLRVAGRALRLELPDFEVLPRSYLGDRYVEVRVPIIRRTF